MPLVNHFHRSAFGARGPWSAFVAATCLAVPSLLAAADPGSPASPNPVVRTRPRAVPSDLGRRYQANFDDAAPAVPGGSNSGGPNSGGPNGEAMPAGGPPASDAYFAPADGANRPAEYSTAPSAAPSNTPIANSDAPAPGYAPANSPRSTASSAEPPEASVEPWPEESRRPATAAYPKPRQTSVGAPPTPPQEADDSSANQAAAVGAGLPSDFNRPARLQQPENTESRLKQERGKSEFGRGP